MDRATGDADFVFAGKIRELTIVFEGSVDLHELGGGVDDFFGVEARDWAADDIAGDISASATGGDSDAGEFGKNRGDFVDAQPVELDGHAGRDVAEAVAEAIGEFGEFDGLGGGELATWEAQAHHEVATFFGFLTINAIPLHAIEVLRINGFEA